MNKPTDKKVIKAMEQIFGKTVWDDIEVDKKRYQETGEIDFTCIKCGNSATHKEKTTETGERVIICSKCGDKYMTASAIREWEQSEDWKARNKTNIQQAKEVIIDGAPPR